MAANTKAGRRNGSYKRSQQAIAGRSGKKDSGFKRDTRHNQKDYVQDRRIYTVKVSTRSGTCIYKAWEHSDEKMNQHFRDADEANTRFFSFTDVRGKNITNVDLVVNHFLRQVL